MYDGETVKSSVGTDVKDTKDDEQENEESGEYSGFLFPNSNKELITDEEVEKKVKDKDDCQRAINEIYARYGYKFTSTDNLEFFQQYDWYNELEKNSSMDEISNRFNNIEKENVAKLQEYSREQDW